MAGILTWLLSIAGLVAAFIFAPLFFLFGAVALSAAIVAVVFGSKSKNESDLGTIGFILGLIFLILAGIVLLFSIIGFVLLILAFSA